MRTRPVSATGRANRPSARAIEQPSRQVAGAVAEAPVDHALRRGEHRRDLAALARVVVQRADHRGEHAAAPVRRLHRDRRHRRDGHERAARHRQLEGVRAGAPDHRRRRRTRTACGRARRAPSCRAGRAVRGGAPNPRRSTSSIAGSSASVIGADLDGHPPVLLGRLAGRVGISRRRTCGRGRRPLGRSPDRADVREPGEQQHERDEEDARPAVAREDDGEEPAEHPERAGSASRTARTRGRGPRRRRRAAAGCRTRAARTPPRPRSRSRRRSSAAASVRPRREHERARSARRARRRGSTPRGSAGAAAARRRVPIPVPTALIRSTTPNIHAGSFDDFSTNAAKNVKKPTSPRSRPIAVPAATMLRRVQRVALVDRLRRADLLGPRDAERREHPERRRSPSPSAAPTARPAAAGSRPRSARPRCRRGC